MVMTYADALDVVVEAAEDYLADLPAERVRRTTLTEALDIVLERKAAEHVEPPRRPRWEDCPVCGATPSVSCSPGCVAIDLWAGR